MANWLKEIESEKEILSINDKNKYIFLISNLITDMLRSDLKSFRSIMIKIAALAIHAIEWVDKNES